ncbi:MAG: zinc-ribbon domain containing protein [candidate division Zixibacteria bacterium]|nr:zinc-ribbon domain containing protein [candidate division Zixibacteria bacterium]
MTLKGIDCRILVCRECGEEFVFTVDAQEYWARLGKTGDPQYCRSCHIDIKRHRKNTEPPQ